MAIRNSATRELRQEAILARLRRVEGQLRGVQRMISEGDDCEAVAQQLSAARRALDRAFYSMIACGVEQELTVAGGDAHETRAAVSRITDTLVKYG